MLATIGQVASIAGSIGKLFGGGGGTSNADAYNKMVEQAHISRADIPLRVQAYKDAGIHPLYGMAGQQYQPSVVSPTEGRSMGDDLQSLGQNVSRFAATQQTKEDRAKQAVMDTLQLERAQLENDLLRSQITSINRPTTPPIPSGVPNYNTVGFDSSILPGDVQLVPTRSGAYAVVPATDVKQNIEDMVIPEAQWYSRLFTSPAQPNYAYNPFTSEYVPINSDTLTAKVARRWRANKKDWQSAARWVRSGFKQY